MAGEQRQAQFPLAYTDALRVAQGGKVCLRKAGLILVGKSMICSLQEAARKPGKRQLINVNATEINKETLPIVFIISHNNLQLSY